MQQWGDGRVWGRDYCGGCNCALGKRLVGGKVVMTITLRMLVLVWDEYGQDRAYVLYWQGDQQDRGPNKLSIHEWASDEINGVGRLGENMPGLEYPTEPGVHLFEGTLGWQATPSHDEPEEGHAKFEGSWRQVELPELPAIDPMTDEQWEQRYPQTEEA